MARSNRWYVCNEYALSFLPLLWRAISMISNLHIHDMIRPEQPAAGYDSSQPQSFLSRRYGGQYYWYHIAIYTRWYALYNLQPATIHLKPHSLLSPDAMEGNINDIISQYTRGDTPCTTCSRLRFISNLTHFSLQTLWRAILMISYRNIHEVIPCTTYSRWRCILNLTHLSLQTLWRAILMISYRNIHDVIRPVQPAAGYDSSLTSIPFLSKRYGGQY